MWSMEVIEIGSCQAILSGISTKVDGSIKVTLEINPDNQEILSKLLSSFATNEKLLQVAFLKVLNG
jgi:hypothetical protein